jgi:uncharacterized protein involved in type VI secretion and phage assembly
MAFELVSSEIGGLVKRTLLNDVTISRYLYRHSEARVVVNWDERVTEGNRTTLGLQPTANLGAAMLNAPVKLIWKGWDLQSNVECFDGYVARVEAKNEATTSKVVLHCVSLSMRTDLVRRYRVWQFCTLMDICQHVAEDTTFQIMSDASSALSGISINLSVQYDETDFAYLGRMLHAWGIPMSVNDETGKVCIGSPAATASGAFPGEKWHNTSVTLDAELIPVDATSRSAGAGAVGVAKKEVNQFNGDLNWLTSTYLPRLDDNRLAEREWIAGRIADTAFNAHSAVYRIRWGERSVFDCPPGSGVPFANAAWMVRESHIHGDPDSQEVSHEIVIQDYPSPLPMQRRRVQWPGRMLWATVTQNNGTDPTREGRMQVQFDIEELDSTVHGDTRCWLPTITPYAGLKGTSGTSGLLCLPEVGERVLVQFLGDWDSDAVVVGSVRDYARTGFIYDPEQTKRLQTPSGNQITLTSRPDGSELVKLKVQDKLVFQGSISSGKQVVIMDVFDSTTERVHFETGSGPARLDIFCGGEIYISATSKLLLEGGTVQITAKSGAVTIDGSPAVNINCGPWSLSPLTLAPDNPTEAAGAQAQNFAKPPKWIAALAAGGGAGSSDASSSTAAAEKKTWISIDLKDDLGNAIPNEKYRIKLPDGSIQEGNLDANGRARVDGIDPGTAQICFPDRDADDWQPAG